MIITRHILKNDLTVHTLDTDGTIRVFDRDFIFRCIDGAKSYLINEKKAKPNQKAVVIYNQWPDYLIWFFAAAELGISFVVSDYPKLTNSFSVRKKLSLYGEIDYVFANPGQELANFYADSKDKIIDFVDFYRYPEPNETIWATDDSVLIYSTSSGTTGTPKVISHTHDFFYKLSERNSKLYNLKSDDRCLHNKSLHHGSVTGVYFLPTMMSCSQHYHTHMYDERLAQLWVPWIQKEKLTRIFIMQDQVEHFSKYLDLEKKTHDELIIYILSKIKKTDLQKIVFDADYKICSIFGCTETSGPVFLPTWTKEKFETINTSNMELPIDDFYKIRLNENQLLEVEMPNASVVCTGDRFSIVDNNWIFLGREDLYRINQVSVFLDILVEIVENYTNENHGEFFDIVIDSEENMIYIRTDEKINLTELNKFISNEIIFYCVDSKNPYYIHKQLIGPRSNFFTGIKFDPEEIRLRCRKLIE